MSKKKATKKAAKKPAKKTTAKKAAVKKAVKKKPAARAAARRLAVAPGQSKKTAAATIFIYKNDAGIRIRTSPQLLTAGPGYIEWTVVNMINDEPVDVDITWPDGSPWGGGPIQIKNGNERKSLFDAKPGRFKYNVTALGYTEDPEVEYPDGM